MTRGTKKLLVLGIDGMDPKLTKKYLVAGRMPNMQKIIDRGARREDLAMLGGLPTVTPPMWTTLSTGAYPCTHGITGYNRLVLDNILACGYNLDSRNCHAEQMWNVTAEAGMKTLVFHWPGSSWPPTSDSPNLHVVDGTQPAAVNMGVAQIESEFVLVASDKTEELIFREKAASDANVPCVITDLNLSSEMVNLADIAVGPEFVQLILKPEDGQSSLTDTPFDVVLSPIKPAVGWVGAPEGAKEFSMLFSKGTIRRICLILRNATGEYDRVAIYKSKKDTMPITILERNVFTSCVIDEAIKNDEKYLVNRNMRALEINPDGNYVKIWVSAAMIIGNDEVWHPKRLHQAVTENVGEPSPESMLGAADPRLIVDCMIENWEVMAKWQADALNYLIGAEQYQVVFSHFHNIDGCGHMIVKFMKQRANSRLSEQQYAEFMALVYEQTDRYIGRFLHFLDEEWTVIIVSDHAQVSPKHEPPMLCDSGVSVRVMEELELTALKKDAQGNDLYEIDWAKTKAIAHMDHIILNLKSKYDHGIVEPEDQYEVEEEIMTKLYGYKDKKTGNRVVALALRNKDAYLLGMGGLECGDIIFFLAEGYNFDHADSLSTTLGYADTSVAPIFVVAGAGVKAGMVTERIIRQVDMTPTIAMLLGTRMPAQCEGAPIYQILQ